MTSMSSKSSKTKSKGKAHGASAPKPTISLPSPSPTSPVPINDAPSEKTNVPALRRKRPAEPILDPPAKHPAVESVENNEKTLEEKKEALKYIPLLLFKVKC